LRKRPAYTKGGPEGKKKKKTEWINCLGVGDTLTYIAKSRILNTVKSQTTTTAVTQQKKKETSNTRGGKKVA